MGTRQAASGKLNDRGLDLEKTFRLRYLPAMAVEFCLGHRHLGRRKYDHQRRYACDAVIGGAQSCFHACHDATDRINTGDFEVGEVGVCTSIHAPHTIPVSV